MTKRIERTFEALREAERKAIVAHIFVGDPSIDESMDIAAAAVEGGADILELAVPFSDSTEQGAVSARAAGRAIAQGASLARVLDRAGRLVERVGVPVVLSSHHAPVLMMHERRLARLSRQNGVDAVLVLDLPPGERNLLRAVGDAGLAMVPFATLTAGGSSGVDAVLEERAKRPDAPRGYIHLLSGGGGNVRSGLDPDAPDAPPPSTRALGLISARVQAAALRARAEMPVVIASALGAGIDSGSSARKAAGPAGEGADGVVVDGVITLIIEDSTSAAERVERVRALVMALREGLDAAPNRPNYY